MYIDYILEMSKKEQTAHSLSNLLDVYNEALVKNKLSKQNNIEFEVRFKQTQSSNFDKIYDELIMRGFKVEFSGYLLRIGVTYQNDQIGDKQKNLSNIRVELDNMNHIQELCTKNTLNSNARFVSKRHVDEKHNSPYMIYDYNLRVSIQNEIERMTQSSDHVLHIKNRWDNSYKHFRYMYRTSLVHEDMPNIRIDLSKVRTNRDKTVYFMDSNVLNSREIYEVEVELTNIHRSFDRDKKAQLLKQLQNSIKFILSSLQGSPFPVKYSELDRVYESYMKTIGKWNDKKIKSKKGDRDGKSLKSGKDFIGPSSCTLQPINFVNDDTIENICVQRDSFCVTDKADGERKMLYIDQNMSLYFINTNLEIQFTGVKVEGLKNYENTIIDGEYISVNKYGESISLYAAFDIYYYDGKNVRERPFKETGQSKKGRKIECRYDLLNKVILNINENIVHVSEMNRVEFSVKSFYFSQKEDPNSLFIANDNCLKRLEKSEYNTDGLIFTPMELGVTQEKRGDTIKNSKYSWGQSFKWKPPEFNTIDFLVSIEKDNFNKAKTRQKLMNENLVNYHILKLNVGVDKTNHGLIGSQQKLLNEDFEQVNSGKEYNEKYGPELFYPTNPSDPLAHLCHVTLQLHEGKMKMFTEENQIIEDDTIVEFRYDTNARDKMNSWIPLRIRDDKTKEYKTKKNNFGNAYHVANSNWHSIHNPVTVDLLTGVTRITKDSMLDVENDVYYNNSKKTKRGISHTIRLRSFHNLVKEMLIRYASNKKEKSSLIDLAVGKAGDLHKWLNNNIHGILGIDISEDNIHNPHDGACKRYIELFAQKKMRRGLKENPMFGMFISGDTSKSIEDGSFDIYNSENNKNAASSNYILKCLMGAVEMNNIKEDYLKNNYNRFKDKFDICSIQFAVHYMFEDKKKLYNFAKNVSDMTHIGSYFIGTCYDGKAVYEKLKDIEYNKSVELYKNSDKIWSIRKKYQDGDDSFMENNELSLGRKISVFQESINKEFDEYLVNFEYFEKVMNDHGFILDDDFAIEDQKMSPTESFENIYKNMIHNGMRNNKINMTDDEKTISFLNKCFVFKKVNTMVKSYTSDEDDNQKKLLSVGFPKKTAEAVILQQL
uniref:mRNA (guanine-N(7))-methyltransferase n=1 Tax=viral metagenome TaxID=1070528 RepID=A0A6C0KYU3_9ZZZZ|tara:strand:+ start:1117 stop:4443 length:3327 start_codon:yes stop_codon:yes gene_type:complete